MGLTPGTKLGPYEIHSLVGAGGMSEVYGARDTRLGRDVAIKALSQTLVNDADRLRRFEQEAARLPRSISGCSILTARREDSSPTSNRSLSAISTTPMTVRNSPSSAATGNPTSS